MTISSSDSVSTTLNALDIRVAAVSALVSLPSLAFASAISQAEGNSGTTVFTYPVTLTRNGSTATILMPWTVTGSGANPATADDFVGGVFPSGMLTFTNGGPTVQNVIVNVLGDTTVEPDNGFIVTGTPQIQLSPAITVGGTITNDDTAPLPVITSPLLVEGDSNTAWGYAIGGWLKQMLMRMGGRFYLTPGGVYAAAGAGVSIAAYGDNSMQARQPAFVAKCVEMMQEFGDCHTLFQIGTNSSGDANGDITVLEAWVAEVRGTGAKVYANTCPTFGGAFSGTGYADILNAWLLTPGSVDVVNDVNSVTDGTATDSGATHYNSLGDLQVGQLAATNLIAALGTSDIYSVPNGGTVVPMTGTGGTIAGTGQLPTGWTSATSYGSDITMSQTITNGVIHIEATAGPIGGYIYITTAVNQVMSLGDVVDGWATVNLISTTDTVWSGLALGFAGGSFPWPEQWPTYDAAEWTGDFVWRQYPVNQTAAGTSVSIGFTLKVDPSTSVVYELSKFEYAIRETAEAVAPVNTVAPVLSPVVVGQALVCSDGTWTGSPAPTFTQQFYIGQSIVSSSYLPVAGDVGGVVTCYVTAANSQGQTSIVSNAVTITAATTGSGSGSSGSSGAQLDSTYKSNVLTYSNSNTTVTVINAVDSSSPRTTTGKTTGQWYFEVTFGGGSPLIGSSIADDGTTGSGTAYWLANGSYWWPNSNSPSFAAPSYAIGDTLCVALDADKKLVWFKTQTGTWNGDPIAGTGGLDLSGITTGDYYAGMFLYPTANDFGTLDLASSSWKAVPPTGYSAW